MNTGDGTSGKLVGALVNGIAVLRYLLKEKKGVGVTQVARDLGINPSTCFNLLKTLVHERLVGFDPTTKTYYVSIGVLSLAQGALDREAHIRLLHPEIQRIALSYNIGVNLWQAIDDDRVLVVDRAEPNTPLAISRGIGQRLPIFSGAFGRCFAAWSDLPKSSIERRYNRIRQSRPMLFEDWYSEVEKTRENGYAMDRGHFTRGITSVAVPILDAEDRAILAVSAIGISEQIEQSTLDRLIPEMVDLSSRATGTMLSPG